VSDGLGAAKDELARNKATRSIDRWCCPWCWPILLEVIFGNSWRNSSFVLPILFGDMENSMILEINFWELLEML
jgi:hypothetical protein